MKIIEKEVREMQNEKDEKREAKLKSEQHGEYLLLQFVPTLSEYLTVSIIKSIRSKIIFEILFV